MSIARLYQTKIHNKTISKQNLCNLNGKLHASLFCVNNLIKISHVLHAYCVNNHTIGQVIQFSDVD